MPDTPATQPPEPQKKMSKGEKLFNWLVYGGIAGVTTFVLTVPVAYQAKYGKWANSFKSSVKWLERYFSKQTAEDIMNTHIVGNVGHAMTIPVAIAENYKDPIVTALNKKLGDEQPPQEFPKLNFLGVLKSRLLVSAAAFLSIKGFVKMFGASRFDAFERKFSEHIVCKPFGKPTHINGLETTRFKVGRIAAIDVFVTTAASAMLYVCSRMFARKDKDPDTLADEVKDAYVIDADPPQTPVPSRSFAETIASRKQEAQASPALAMGQ